MCEDFYILECPNCKNLIQIFKNEVNCKIFRHAVYKNNNEPINPHSGKQNIEELKRKDLIYGCGIPLKLEDKKLVICDYI